MPSDISIDKDRLVEWASRAIDTPSFTGSEEAMAELMRETFFDLGLQAQWQQVEDGRANVLGTRAGTGGGPSLMFNGHMDTSYSGREPWLRHVPGFQPKAFVEDGRLYGLGISNMKGALACYVEALRALGDAGIRLRGDVMIAAVSGEIEKTQWGEAQGIRRFVASISPRNEPSLTIIRRLGFVRTGEQWDEEDGLEHVFELVGARLPV